MPDQSARLLHCSTHHLLSSEILANGKLIDVYLFRFALGIFAHVRYMAKKVNHCVCLFQEGEPFLRDVRPPSFRRIQHLAFGEVHGGEELIVRC